MAFASSSHRTAGRLRPARSRRGIIDALLALPACDAVPMVAVVVWRPRRAFPDGRGPVMAAVTTLGTHRTAPGRLLELVRGAAALDRKAFTRLYGALARNGDGDGRQTDGRPAPG